MGHVLQDMPIYQPAIHGTGRDEYEQLAEIFTAKKINNVDKKKITTTSDDAQTKETGTSEAEYDMKYTLHRLCRRSIMKNPLNMSNCKLLLAYHMPNSPDDINNRYKY